MGIGAAGQGGGGPQGHTTGPSAEIASTIAKLHALAMDPECAAVLACDNRRLSLIAGAFAFPDQEIAHQAIDTVANLASHSPYISEELAAHRQLVAGLHLVRDTCKERRMVDLASLVLVQLGVAERVPWKSEEEWHSFDVLTPLLEESTTC